LSPLVMTIILGIFPLEMCGKGMGIFGLAITLLAGQMNKKAAVKNSRAERCCTAFFHSSYLKNGGVNFFTDHLGNAVILVHDGNFRLVVFCLLVCHHRIGNNDNDVARLHKTGCCTI
jgi:hypothetical protein